MRSRRKLLEKTGEPGQEAQGSHGDPEGVGDVRAKGLSSARTATIDTEATTERHHPGDDCTGGDHPLGVSVRTVWIPADYDQASHCWLAGEPQERRADLAAGRAQSAPETAEANETVVE